ncbi:MAG: hypothetical protein P1P82_09350 [Bacteroidales bacterium]|nr:hypothetical protein [Bacteroidales bacterium]
MINSVLCITGYSGSNEKLCYWRTSSGYEVDAIIGEGRIAIEIKSVEEIKSRHLKGLKGFLEDYPKARAIVVSLDQHPRILNGIEILPAKQFLKLLWNKEIV